MRRALLGCGLLCLLLLSVGAGSAPQVVTVANHSMETVSEGRTLPDGYFQIATGAIAVDNYVAADGKRSLKYVLRGHREWLCAYTSADGSVIKPGQTFHIRVKVRTHDLQGEAFITAYQYPAPLMEAQSKARLSGTNDWTTIDMPVVAKEGIAGVQIRLIVSGTGGRAWFDDLQMIVEEAR